MPEFSQPDLLRVPGQPPEMALQILLEYTAGRIVFCWFDKLTRNVFASIAVSCSQPGELTWKATHLRPPVVVTNDDRNTIQQRVEGLRRVMPVCAKNIECGSQSQGAARVLTLPSGVDPWTWVVEEIKGMADQISNPELSDFMPPGLFDDSYLRRLERKAQKAEQAELERQERIRSGALRMQKLQREREKRRRERQASPKPTETPVPFTTLAAPPISLIIDAPALEFQETMFAEPDWQRYLLQERAALWWVSNQSDDLLALPHCRIERLEYQLRTALRVMGPLRGRALLSDEVGLGKTIEAGLVLKEYLVRGMIKRFLILTVPSLVDQWQEELQEKFGLDCATTNQPSFRADPLAFWTQNPYLIASLHTIKQPAHLAALKTVNWDLLVVDEAHYLRNRASQAWQAVNELPRQFMLLLTATPVQNSLEELYNLVTLLQPGQLPAPREFNRRFLDKAHPHQPKEPEELRRLLSQVMIRNTRANAGLNLPPRRAETVLIDPDEVELAFWESWESELREELNRLPPAQASLWGRLLLQAVGSSPAAWREALQSFPAPSFTQAWLSRVQLDLGWSKKCQFTIPLARAQNGVVVFTQFLKTQAALAERLRAEGLPVWVINGQTPAAKRQPLTDEFRQQGGALLLTHSGTEGRNLQFCHQLVNLDLPWNPMEIEQRIGRLHRLGQTQPVRVYNFVQKNTLQEHLLNILQEKLNLFELVVGETGLILGERFSAEEFADEVLRRWRESQGKVAEAMQALGDELAQARDEYQQVKKLDSTLFSQDYETQ